MTQSISCDALDLVIHQDNAISRTHAYTSFVQPPSRPPPRDPRFPTTGLQW